MKKYSYISVLILFTVMVSCSRHDQEDRPSSAHHKSTLTKIKLHNDSISYDISVEPYLSEIKKALAEVNDSVVFLIPARKIHIQSFPCSSCHNTSLAELKSNNSEKHQRAHWNIDMIHAPTNVMDCKTCHDTNNLDALRSLTGESIDFDQSFKNCSQCHSTQYKDWIGGSHGKRIGGWAPPKVMNTCVNCHNPHKPSFETRLPSRYNTVTPSKISDK